MPERPIPAVCGAIQCDKGLTSAFQLLGKRWTGMVIGILLERPARFGEIAAGVPGITEAMLSSRLAELQEARLVERTVDPGPPITSTYGLTPAGKALEPALGALMAWAQEHLPEPVGAGRGENDAR